MVLNSGEEWMNQERTSTKSKVKKIKKKTKLKTTITETKNTLQGIDSV